MPANTSVSRLDHVRTFYQTLASLEEKLGGSRSLGQAYTSRDWPRRGVYFFFENGEERTTSGSGLRVVRVGTHGLAAGSHSTLWGRLHQHRGNIGGRHAGGGNHRGSVFRLHVGTALIRRDGWQVPSLDQWMSPEGLSGTAQFDEDRLERAVSIHIRSMPFLWLAVEDDPGPNSLRGYVERNAIALLSNCLHPSDPIDPPCGGWLGLSAYSDDIKCSGLWNVRQVRDQYDPAFLTELQRLVAACGALHS